MTKHNITTCTVYGLQERGSDEIRYIGQTAYSVENRLKRHWAEARNGNKTARSNWMRSVAEAGGEIEIVALEEGADWNEAEKAWIAAYRASGNNLFNHTDGGQGWTPGKPKPAKWSATFSAAQKRNYSRPEVKQKQRAGVIAERQTPEGYARVCEQLRRAHADPDMTAKRLAKVRQTKCTAEWRAGQSERTRQQMADPEARKRIAETNRQRMQDPENRAKAAEGARKGWADPVKAAERRKKLSEAAKRRHAREREQKNG
jgi:hypothetical protein